VGDANYGIAARLLSQGLRKYVTMWGRMRVGVLFLNQLRYKMNAGLF
jgi:RecA/RadA recombinase